MTDVDLNLRPLDPVETRTVETIALPRSVWQTIERAAEARSLALADVFAQLAYDRVTAATVAANRPARRTTGGTTRKTRNGSTTS